MVLSIEEIEKRINDSYELPNRVLDVMPEPMVTVRTSTYQHAPFIMCIASVMYPLHSINLNILKVKARSDLFLYLEIIKKILYLEIIKKIMILIILFISYCYGVIGILIGQIIGSVLAYIPNSYFSAKLIDYAIESKSLTSCPALAYPVHSSFANLRCCLFDQLGGTCKTYLFFNVSLRHVYGWLPCL